MQVGAPRRWSSPSWWACRSGLVAGVLRPVRGLAVSGLTDTLLAFPFLVLAVGLAAVLGRRSPTRPSPSASPRSRPSSASPAPRRCGSSTVDYVPRPRSPAAAGRHRPLPAHPAQRHLRPDRAGDRRRPHRHHRRGAAELPRPRRPAAGPARWGVMLSGAQSFLAPAPWMAVFPASRSSRRRWPSTSSATGCVTSRPREGVPVTVVDPRQDRPAGLLSVRDLSVTFHGDGGAPVHAVDGRRLDLAPGEVLAVVGESGCGKSVTSLAVWGCSADRPSLRVSRSPLARARTGRAPEKELRTVRGRDLSMIFQEPMTSLNPVLTVGGRSAKCSAQPPGCRRKEARDRAVELLELVGIPIAAARRRVPPPALRRYAAARHARHRGRLRPGCTHRRRADDGARRDGPGRRPGRAHTCAQGPAGHRDRADHPRPRAWSRTPRTGFS